MIIRVPPHYEYFAWSVGPRGFEMMMVPRRRLPDLVDALSRFVLAPPANFVPFSA